MSQFVVFDVIHRPGCHHSNADSMSMMPYQQCGRPDEEVTETDPKVSRCKPMRYRVNESVDVPQFKHTTNTDESVEEAMYMLMLNCAVTIRAQAAKALETQKES
jgi:hypothetical protein